jgi:membrane protein YqaA with SNARE-associated domain
MVYLTLFFIALISGSLFPLGSEGVLIYDLKQGYNPFLLLLFATIGNTLGAVINYYLGLKGEEYLEKKGYLNASKLQNAKDRFKRYGAYALLLSPLPIVGDPITFIAGVLKYNFKKFLLIVFFAKAIRYITIAQLPIF